MTKFKKPDATSADAPGPRPATIAVTRRWLAALMVCILAPWLVVGILYLRSGTAGGAVNPPVRTESANAEVLATAASGSWGTLEITPIVISPPIEYVPTNWGPVEEPVWYFPNTSAESLEAFLASAGMGRDDLAGVVASARPAAPIQGVVVRPGEDLVRRLSPEVRARIYLQLGKNPRNEDQAGSYRFYGATFESWLGSDLSPATRRLLEPLIYRQGNFMFFADFDLVRARIADALELQRVAKRLLRQGTALVRIRVDADSDIGAIADYWGRGGRRTDIRPLLESVATAGPGADHLIDITHLLPPLVRQHLYRYPKITVADFEKPLLANCFWTALNFFNATPDDRFLDIDFALKHLKEDYYVIQDGYQLGDIVAFSDVDGRLFHVTVFLADNLVFGKNGSSYLAPWSILPMARLKGHYVENADQWQVTVHRRKDL